MVNNYKGFEMFSASAYNILYENNSMKDSDGIMISPSESAPKLFNVILHLDIVGNTLADLAGLRPAFIAIVPREDLQSSSMGSQIIGANITSNNVTGFTPNPRVTNPAWDDYKVVTEGYLCEYYWQSNGGYNEKSPSPIVGTIFQDNLSVNADNAFYLNSGASQTAIVGTFATNSGQIRDVAIPGANRSSTGTVMAGSLSTLPITGISNSAATNLFGGLASPYGSRAIGVSHSLTGTSSGPAMMLGQQVTGDAQVSVRTTLSSGSSSTGLLVFSGGASDGALVGVGLKEGAIEIITKQFQHAATSVNIPFASSSAWLELQRTGSKIVVMYSSDGATWTKEPPILLTFPSRIYDVGISAISSGTQPAMDVTFEGFTITATAVNTPPVQTSGTRAPSNNPVLKLGRSIGRVAVSFWKVLKAAISHLV
jgi:hypothetical protein